MTTRSRAGPCRHPTAPLTIHGSSSADSAALQDETPAQLQVTKPWKLPVCLWLLTIYNYTTHHTDIYVRHVSRTGQETHYLLV